MHAFLQPLPKQIASVLQPLPLVLRQTLQLVWERAAQVVHFMMAVDVCCFKNFLTHDTAVAWSNTSAMSGGCHLLCLPAQGLSPCPCLNAML